MSDLSLGLNIFLFYIAVALYRRTRLLSNQLGVAQGFLKVHEIQDAQSALIDSIFFQSAFEHIPNVGCAYVGLNNELLKCNRAFHVLSGNPHLRGKTWMDITHKDDIAMDAEAVQKLKTGKCAWYAMSKRYVFAGKIHWVKIYVTLKHQNLQPLHYVVIIRPLFQNELRVAEVKYHG